MLNIAMEKCKVETLTSFGTCINLKLFHGDDLVHSGLYCDLTHTLSLNVTQHFFMRSAEILAHIYNFQEKYIKQIEWNQYITMLKNVTIWFSFT